MNFQCPTCNAPLSGKNSVCSKCGTDSGSLSRIFRESYQNTPDKVFLNSGDELQLDSGKYFVQKKIGHGGFGVVHMVRNERGDSFAMKTLKLWELLPNEYDEIKARFKQGFRAGRIESKNLVRSFFQGSISGNPYIIMEFCDGGNLGDRLNDFKEESAFNGLGINILRGLKDLHDNGIIHRDVKPDNILFAKDDLPKLTDFDISGYVNKRLTAASWMGRANEVWGTAVYAPPEQLDHRKALPWTKPSMDMFAFGVMMYEVVSGGYYPFGGFEEFQKNPKVFYKKVKKGKYVPVTNFRSDISSTWVDVIHGCIIPDPKKRTQNPKAVLDKLKDSGAYSFSYELPKPVKNEWVLRVLNGFTVGKEYNMTQLSSQVQKDILRLGWFDKDNPESNDIGIEEVHTSFISGQHATLEREDGIWVIRDGQWFAAHGWKKSSNGTQVNGKEVDQDFGYILNSGDVVTVGDTTLKVLHI